MMGRKWNHLRIVGSGSRRTIVLDNPPVNALSSGMLEDLYGALCEYDERRDVAFITLASDTRTRGFSAGANIRELKEITDEKDPRVRRNRAYAFSRRGQRVVRQLLAMQSVQTTTEAHLRGVVAGGGLELALACYHRYVSAGECDSFRWGLPEVGLGVIPGWGGTVLLPRVLAIRRDKKASAALQLITTGLVSSYSSARAFGIVEGCEASSQQRQDGTRVVSPHAVELVNNLFLCNRDLSWDLPVVEKALQNEADTFAEAMAHPDAREGIRAFLEKRKPHFAP